MELGELSEPQAEWAERFESRDTSASRYAIEPDLKKWTWHCEVTPSGSYKDNSIDVSVYLLRGEHLDPNVWGHNRDQAENVGHGWTQKELRL